MASAGTRQTRSPSSTSCCCGFGTCPASWRPGWGATSRRADPSS
jgi:hypothetical protein